MSKSIKQLKDDLAVLTTNVQLLGSQLQQLYASYLKDLGNAVSQQLILASYQICTQKYPESFLNLSFRQRSDLQQHLKQLSSTFNQKLADYLLKLPVGDLKIEAELKKLLTELSSENQTLAPEGEPEEIGDRLEPEGDEPDSRAIEGQKASVPDDIIELHLEIENIITETLNDLSQAANKYLQKVKILPDQLPPKLLDMALQAEEAGSAMSAPPNLLNLLIEKEQGQDRQEIDIIKITAICLRIAEIEFAEASLGAQRNQIRTIVTKVEQLKEQYAKKLREYAIAAAESAWRSSWFEG